MYSKWQDGMGEKPRGKRSECHQLSSTTYRMVLLTMATYVLGYDSDYTRH